ncbi:condensin complex subunit 2-like [Glandiceps talaboti]
MPSVREEMLSPVPSKRLPSTPSSDFISPTTHRHRSRVNHQSPLLSNVQVNDDDEERRQRRRSKVLEMQRTLQSPVATPGDRRRLSIGSGSFSNAQVIEHYSNCIKLSAENKITAKNAFSLHLIDHMSELIKQKEKTGGMTNFQVASCTLDASAKIYAGRIDSIHADTYKMLGGLGRDNEKQTQENGDVMDDDDDERGKKKKQKRARKKNRIETNLNNIKGKHLQMDFEVDPLFNQMAAEFDAGGVAGLLLNQLCVNDDSSELLLDAYSVANVSSLTAQTDQNTDTVDLSDIRALYKSVNLEGAQICPEFASFEFANWDDSEESPITKIINEMGNNEHAFDLNAEPEPIDISPDPSDLAGGGDYSDDDMCSNGDGNSFDDKALTMMDGKEAKLIQNREELDKAYQKVITDGTMGQLCLLIAQEQTEYSYLNLDMLKTWAGPEHWKLRARSKDASGSSKVDGKKRKEKPAFRVDYEEDINFDKLFTKTKASTTLTKATVEKWNENATTLPPDLHYNPDNLFKLFLKPKLMVKRQVESEDKGLDDGIDNYNYENANDCNNFCPGVEDDDDDDAGSGISGMDFSTGGGGELSQTTTSQGSFGVNDSLLDGTLLSQNAGDGLVAQPHRVAKIDIQYARTAKKIDVKKLKASMWGLLTVPKEIEKEKVETIPSMDDNGVAGIQSFNNMYKSLPDQISTHMAKNLSIPMCFVCLLHLANEKNLKIDGVEAFGDLLISQDNFT